jgi:hypothetical protein
MKNSRGLVKKVLIAVPFAIASVACAPKVPVESDYFTGVAPISIGSDMNSQAKDLDKDGQGDAIVSSTGKALYYVKGYENAVMVTKTSMEMTPELREDVTNYIKADNNLRFHAAKLEYETNKAKYDSAGVKK